LGPASDFAADQRMKSFVGAASPTGSCVRNQVVAWRIFQLKLPGTLGRMKPFATSSRKALLAVSFATWISRAASRTAIEISPHARTDVRGKLAVE
jgi:hypothetical protein